MTAAALTDQGGELALLSLTGQNPTLPTNIYMGLASAAATPEDGLSGITELPSANGYTTRLEMTSTLFSSAASAGSIANDGGAIEFPAATGAGYTVTHVFLADSATIGAGVAYAYHTLPVSKTVAASQQFRFVTGEFSIDAGAGTDWADNFANLMADLLAGRDPTFPTTTHAAVLTAAPNLTAGTYTEQANENGYAREALSTTYFPASVADPQGAGIVNSVAALEFGPCVTANWASASTHLGILDSATHSAGNLLAGAALGSSISVEVGDSLTIGQSGFTLTAG